MSGHIRVLTERVMSRGFEPTVARVMEQMRNCVKKQPGLISVESWGEMSDHHKHIVVSEWKSQKEYQAWEETPEYKKLNATLSQVLDKPGKNTRIFRTPKEDIFLL